MEPVYIISAARTAVGTIGGALASVSSPDLGAIVIKEALKRGNVPGDKVDEVIMGCVLQAGLYQGPARQAAIKAGIPETVPAWTVNQICGSALKSVALAQALINNGEAQCVVAGGMENMSQAPYLASFVRNPRKMGNVEMQDSMITDGLTDAFSHEHMGLTAEAVAEKYHLTREELDAFSADSQRKAEIAITTGAFAEEIVEVVIPQRKGDPVIFKQDEHPRFGTTAQTLAKLRPSFKPDGVVTAGNASGINDGAACVIVASESFVKEHNLKPMAKIVATATTALDPNYMGLGPISASRKALQRASWNISDLDAVELNEAFASQSVACIRELGFNPDIVNINGGAIALGHPIGCSGARILVTLLYRMVHNNNKRGLASLCIGGGMGCCVLVERD